METFFTHPLWWHWAAFGLVLIVSEIILPSFVAIWFGIAAIIISLLDYLLKTTFKTELFLWIILSSFFIYLWFKFFKHKTISNSGQADEDMGIKGIITEHVEPFGRGKAKFETPILGSSEWTVLSDESITVGETVKSIQAIGNMIKVKKLTH